jgi:hypothetical protein
VGAHCWRLGCETKWDRAKTAPTLNTLLGYMSYEAENESNSQEGAVDHTSTVKFETTKEEDKDYEDEVKIPNVDYMLGIVTNAEDKIAPNYPKVKVDERREGDEWREHGLWLVREHQKPRRDLFTPMRVEGSPPARMLIPVRVTTGRFTDGMPFRRVDTWTARSTAHARLSREWIGSTAFLLRDSKEYSPKVV